MRSAAFSILALAACCASAQQLTLPQALDLAREKNGTITAAYQSLEAARARMRQARGTYLPSVTPSVQYSDSRTDTNTGPGAGSPFIQSGTTSMISAKWTLFDSGQRDLAYKSASLEARAEESNALLTLRNTLLTVHSQFLDTIRFQKLVEVQKAQVARAEDVQKQVEAQIKVGDAAEKDKYQPQADALNARVSLLATENQLAKARAALKGTLGIPPEDDLPELVAPEDPKEFVQLPPLKTVLDEALANRADLTAQRLRLDSQRSSVRSLQLDAGITWALQANYTKQFGPDNLNNRLFTFNASYPLFDGAQSREAVRSAKSSLAASQSTLLQSERTATAEVRGAYDELQISADRIKAAQAAREASAINYEKVSNSFNQFHVGTVVDVSTAALALATADKNLIDAIYDYFIADVQFRLVSGRPIPGEIAG